MKNNYRARRKSDGVWIESNSIIRLNDKYNEPEVYMPNAGEDMRVTFSYVGGECTELHSINDCHIHAVVADSVCRNTGMIDEDGKELFEKDLIELDNDYAIILWDEGGAITGNAGWCVKYIGLQEIVSVNRAMLHRSTYCCSSYGNEEMIEKDLGHNKSGEKGEKGE